MAANPVALPPPQRIKAAHFDSGAAPWNPKPGKLGFYWSQLPLSRTDSETHFEYQLKLHQIHRDHSEAPE